MIDVSLSNLGSCVAGVRSVLQVDFEIVLAPSRLVDSTAILDRCVTHVVQSDVALFPFVLSFMLCFHYI